MCACVCELPNAVWTHIIISGATCIITHFAGGTAQSGPIGPIGPHLAAQFGMFSLCAGQLKLTVGQPVMGGIKTKFVVP